MPPLCPRGQYTPVYDDTFFIAIERCPKSPALVYCDCYQQAALQSLIRAQEQDVNGKRDAMQQSQDALRRYPRQTEVPGPPLNLPSRANQKANIFTKAFDPKNRKIIVLLIASLLLFVALTSYD